MKQIAKFKTNLNTFINMKNVQLRINMDKSGSPKERKGRKRERKNKEIKEKG